MGERIVFHIDVNSAYLSWSAAYRIHILGEQLDLRTVPAVVGGSQEIRHGIVLAKSIPAKERGIHTGEALVTARNKCPGLVVVPPDYHLYVTASRALMEILQSYSDHVDQYSIDEAWAEFDGFERLYGGMVSFAGDLKQEIREKLGFTVNIGVSTNRLLSKMAGDFKKPDRVHTLFPDEIPHKMWPLPVEKLFFAGNASVKKLHKLGIHTIGELANTDAGILKSHMKKHGEILWNYAWGRELEPYVFRHDANKGYGNSITTPRDIADMDYARQVMLSLCETVGMRLREDQVRISCISVSITTDAFEHGSRQKQLSSATDVTEEIYRAACQIFEMLWDGRTPVRQLGVHTSRVTEQSCRQYDLFDAMDYDKWEKVNRTVDQIRKRFGEDAVQRARFVNGGLSHMSGGLDRERRTGVTLGLDLNKEKTG